MSTSQEKKLPSNRTYTVDDILQSLALQNLLHTGW